MRYFKKYQLIWCVLLAMILVMGVLTSPFGTGIKAFSKWSIPVDALPNLEENQQIVVAHWNGHSPQEIEDLITYPLVEKLRSLPGIQDVRSQSYFGFSQIYVIFEESVEFYWSRDRISEVLRSVDGLPRGVKPQLGPDATGLSQVYWYYLESELGIDSLTRLHEEEFLTQLRTVKGVAEAAHIGGYQPEIHIEFQPDILKHYGLSIRDLRSLVVKSNQELGASTLEMNQQEHLISLKGYLSGIEDLENLRIGDSNLRLGEVAQVRLGREFRRGALDAGGQEKVGGVISVRYGESISEVLDRIELKVETLEGVHTNIEVVDYYHRGKLIDETLQTLKSTLGVEMVITLIVVLMMMRSIRHAILVLLTLPLGISITFIGMKMLGVDANVVALAGIAIAIGSMVDVGIIFSDQIAKDLKTKEIGSLGGKLSDIIWKSFQEVKAPILTSILSTILSFTPVFLFTGMEAKMFIPLAMTKTLALSSILFISIFILPFLAWFIFRWKLLEKLEKVYGVKYALVIMAFFMMSLLMNSFHSINEFLIQIAFDVLVVFGVLLVFYLIQKSYLPVLKHLLAYPKIFLTAIFICILGASWIQYHTESEFMPRLNEGSFLYMPVTVPQAGLEASLSLLQDLDEAIEKVPEVQYAVGKLGRVESALDPAPISMYEVLVELRPKDQWRSHIQNSDQIWNEIQAQANIQGLTVAPKLMPIQNRILMLQSGLRSPFGIRVQGRDLKQLHQSVIQIESQLKASEFVQGNTVISERTMTKSYLNFQPDMISIQNLGFDLYGVQSQIQLALAGEKISNLRQGRELIPIRLKYDPSLKESVDELELQNSAGDWYPSQLLGEWNYEWGPSVIKSEDGYFTTYVVFDPLDGGIDNAQQAYEGLEIKNLNGIYLELAGDFENQQKFLSSLMWIGPIILGFILILLWVQFKKMKFVAIVFSSILLAWSGGVFAMAILGVKSSVAVWVGMIALAGIATDDSVLMNTYLQRGQLYKTLNQQERLKQISLIASQRLRPCLMTSATTFLALLPILFMDGKGSELVVPMSVPIIGGVLMFLVSLFYIPVLHSLIHNE